MRRALAFILVLSIVPLASADWRAAGGLEPDTQRDRDDGLMFLTPDTSREGVLRQVYFQAYAAVPETSLNPNVAFVGSRNLPAPALHHRALLGAWKDCNGDGYIGLAESAIVDYRAELLVDTSICPPIANAVGPEHNTGGWVSELLSVGMVDPCERALDPGVREACGVEAFAPNERVIYVDQTFVWGDLGEPGSIPRAECLLAPLPSGTTTGSGAVIAWADCQSRRGIAQTVNDVDSFFGGIGLGFSDPAHPEDSDSLLNQRFPVTPFGSGEAPGLLQDDTEEESVRVWDCSNEPELALEDPEGYREIALTDPTGQLHAERFPLVVVHSVTGVGFEDEDRDPATPGVFRHALTDEDGNYATVPSVDGDLRDPTASWWVALVDAADGPAGDCDRSTPSPLESAYVGHLVESDATPVLEARKDRTSVTFRFYDGHRGVHPGADPHIGHTFPSDGGTMLLDHGGPPPFGRGGDGPLWSAIAQSEQDPQIVDREDLEPTGPVYFTYYASIGPDRGNLALPSSALWVYGQDNCGDAMAGIVNGWVCDPSLWWRDAHGQDNTPRYAQGMRIGRVPGDVYHLRDVDCYDGEVARGTGLYASGQWIVNAPPCV